MLLNLQNSSGSFGYVVASKLWFGNICRWKCSLWNFEYNNSVQVGYIFQCAFELESWTDIAVVLVPSITLKIQLLELKSSTVRKLNNHLIHLLFQTNRCFHESISLCGISKGQPTNNLFFISYSLILFQSSGILSSSSNSYNFICKFPSIGVFRVNYGHNYLFNIV